MRNLVFILALTFVLGLSFIHNSQAAKQLTEDDVKKIVEDYIRANPEVIIESTTAYNTRTTKEQQTMALKKQSDEIFNSESPFIGNPDASVVVVEFFDYKCGYCKESLPVIQEAVEKDDDLKVVFKEYPILSQISQKAAGYALAAKIQGKYFEMHSALMNNRGNMTEEDIIEMAKDIGLDIDKLKTDAEGQDVKNELARSRLLASQLGIRGTPAFIIGDQVLPGMMSHDKLAYKVNEFRMKQKN